MFRSNEFKFELKGTGNAAGQSQTKTNDESGIVTFEALSFNEAKTYFYELAEVVDASKVVIDEQGNVISGYSYDPTKYIIKIDVTDDSVGNLHATTTYYKESYDPQNPTENVVVGLNFLNGYTPPALVEDLSLDINATKTVTSSNGFELKDGDFTFEVKDVYGNVVATGKNVAPTGTDKSVADIEFTDFTFTQPGEYRYWISEVVDTTKEAYMTYDARSWEVHVSVSYAYDDVFAADGTTVLYPAGTLYIADDGVKTYASSRTLEQDTPAFVNIYTPAPVSLTITADKELIVPEGSERKLQANEFTFRVKDEKGIIRAESHNDADGNITFNFTETVAGEHTYTIVEFVPAVNAGGIDYDKETKGTVTVKVEDDGNGQLTIGDASSITKENVAVFKNTYKPEGPVTAEITAKKIFENGHLEEKAFAFELLNSNGVVINRVGNDVNGNVKFTINFSEAGEYHYTLREVKGTDPQITYDEKSYKVTVEVIDDLAGHLYSEVSYDTADGLAPVFVNTYSEPKPTPEPTPTPDSGVEYKEYTFTKVWNDNNNAAGKRPESIIVKAYQNGVFVTDIVLNEANGWTNKAILIARNGDIVYEWTVKEENVPAGYYATYNQETLTVTNTYGKAPVNGDGQLDDLPPTGDSNNLGLWIALAVLAAGCLAVVIVLGKKTGHRKENEN